MIGSIRISDIPEVIIALVVGIILILGSVQILDRFPGLIERIPDGVYLIAFLLLAGVSYACGHYIWEWILDCFD